MVKIPDFKLGETGRFPYGKLNESDEGEIQVLMVADHPNGVVHIEFGKSVKWLGLSADVARQWGAALIEKADELDKKKH